MSWILLIFIHVGPLSGTNDVALTTARFYREDACRTAGDEISKLAQLTVQRAKFVCIHDAPTSLITP